VNRFLAIVALVALTAAPALADPTSDLKNAMIALASAKSYHLSLTTAGGHTAEGDVVNPGRVHLIAGPMDVIVIDKTTYVKIQGAWHQFAMPGMDRMMGPVAMVQNFAKSHDDMIVTDLGPKTVDGTLLHAYSVKNAGSAKNAVIYLDAAGLPARIENTDSEGLNVVKFSNFNGPISIDPPV
jgi:hypothetical protein